MKFLFSLNNFLKGSFMETIFALLLIYILFMYFTLIILKINANTNITAKDINAYTEFSRYFNINAAIIVQIISKIPIRVFLFEKYLPFFFSGMMSPSHENHDGYAIFKNIMLAE